MDTILVTGGAGFIGSCFVRRALRGRAAHVVNLDKLTYAGHRLSLAEADTDPRHTFVRGDIADRPLVESLLETHRPRAVVNFAAESHVDRSIDGPAAFVHTNVVGAFELLEAARRHWERLSGAERNSFRVLQISTDEVYGSLAAEDPAFNESTPYAPNSPYAASKAAADHLARAYHHTYGLPVLVTHSSNNYGPYQYPEKLIPLMILNALDSRPLPVYGDGRQVRDWLHVEDHCAALELVLAHGQPGETYDIGGSSEHANREVVEMICDAVDRLAPGRPQPSRTLISHVTDRPAHDRRYAIDSSKIRGELGWQPSVDFTRGLEQTVQWYLDHRDWVRTVSEGKYDRGRLGLGGT